MVERLMAILSCHVKRIFPIDELSTNTNGVTMPWGHRIPHHFLAQMACDVDGQRPARARAAPCISGSLR
jgi:hypothetical protein